jgi:ABC-type glutathione transport system ATPase component
VGKTVITATHDLEIIEQISKRAIVMGEDHGVKVDGMAEEVLSDYDLLLAANLIHEHMHLQEKGHYRLRSRLLEPDTRIRGAIMLGDCKRSAPL